MLLLIIGVFIFLSGIALLKYSYDWEAIGVIMILIGFFMFIILGLCKFTSPFDYAEVEIKRDILQEQLDVSENRDKFMDSQLTMQVIAINSKIQKEKFYNTTVWGWYVDDRFMTLEPVKLSD